jgi:hypothetical protein
MAQNGQTYATHVRWFPPFHYFLLPLFMINFLAAAWTAFRAPSGTTLWACLMAFGLAFFTVIARVMALAVQDRVIRLEERLRMREVLPTDLQGRVSEITREQFVGLRFASDGELADLVRRVLAGELKTTTEIKKAVKVWRGDYLRA